MEELRLFIAIDVAEKARSALKNIQDECRKYFDNVKWAPPQNFHITLRFLGDFPAEQSHTLEDAVYKTCLSHSPVKTCFNRIGFFPGVYTPKVIWAGIEDVLSVSKIALSLEKNLSDMGIGPNKQKFSAHLTLGRFRTSSIKDVSRLYQKLPDVRIDTVFDSISLNKSVLTPSGAVYTRLFHSKLNGRSQIN